MIFVEYKPTHKKNKNNTSDPEFIKLKVRKREI